MVFSYVYDFVSYLFYGNNNIVVNEPIDNNLLESRIKSLRRVDTEISRLIKEDIEYNKNRTDHIRSEEDIKNNKPINDFELCKIKNCKIQTICCNSVDLQKCISNLKKIDNVKSRDIIIKSNNIIDELKQINLIGVDAWFNNRKH